MRAISRVTLRGQEALLVAASAAAYLPYAWRRPGWVMDDFWTLRNAALSGSWAAAGHDQQKARPGAGVVYAVVFGWMRDRYWLALVGLFVLGALSAVLLARLLREFVSPALAWAASALWVWLPNHTSTEVWASTANIALSRTCVLGGFCLLVSARPRRALAIAMLVVGVLCYEASLPIAAAGAVALPWLKVRRIDWRATFGAAAALGVAFLWMMLNFHPAKHPVRGFADVSVALPAHFGWGTLGSGPVASLVMLATLAGVLLVAARQLLARYACHRHPGDGLVLGGAMLLVLGVLPFVKFAYEPIGAGDRLNYLTSIGGSLIWIGLLAMLARHRMVLVGLVALLVAGTSVTRLDHTRNWSDARAEAVEVMRVATLRFPAPEGPILVGPKPAIYDNTAAFANRSHVEAALQLAYGDAALQATIIDGEAAFDSSTIEQRIDLRELRSR